MVQSVSGVGVLDKAVTIVDLVAQGPVNLSRLVERTGYSRATTHRLAQALEVHGLLRRDGAGHYVLGHRMVGLGRRAAAMFPLATLAAGELERLRADTGESVQLYVPQGDNRVCVAALDSPSELRTIVEVGSVLPGDRGSAGHVLAGNVAEEDGWVASVAERESGVASVSAPVRDQSGTVIAAVSVSGPIDRITEDPGRRHGSAVVRAAERIERLLSEPVEG